MTGFEQAIMLLHTAFNAVVLWFVWHGPWRNSCQERYRQKLFEIRDELFDFAQSGGVEFTDPAYVALRSQINSLIRFSHLISVTRLATFVVFQRYIGELPQTTPSVVAALSEVKGREAKETLFRIYGDVRKNTARHVLFSSPHVIFAGPVLMLLDQLISRKETPTATPQACQRQPVAVTLIERQARNAYRSEAEKRRHERELALAN